MSSKIRPIRAAGSAALLTAAASLAPAVARAQESAPELPPPDATAMLGFLIVFVGMIVGYILWIMRQQKKQKSGDVKRGDAV